MKHTHVLYCAALFAFVALPANATPLAPTTAKENGSVKLKESPKFKALAEAAQKFKIASDEFIDLDEAIDKRTPREARQQKLIALKPRFDAAKAAYLKQIDAALKEPLPKLVRDYIEKVQSGLTQLPELDLKYMDKVWDIKFHSELLIGMLDMKESEFQKSN